MSDNHLDSWKNDAVASKQLDLNKTELISHNYPPHWEFILQHIAPIVTIDTKVLDIGCGTGSMCKLLVDNVGVCPKNYTGVDYSEQAINLAKQNYEGDFLVMNYKDLSPCYVSGFDIVISSALTNVLPNGDECLEFILSLQSKALFLLKILTTSGVSHYTEYMAYDIIPTYRYEHNINNLADLVNRYHYNILGSTDTNFYLKL